MALFKRMDEADVIDVEEKPGIENSLGSEDTLFKGLESGFGFDPPRPKAIGRRMDPSEVIDSHEGPADWKDWLALPAAFPEGVAKAIGAIPKSAVLENKYRASQVLGKSPLPIGQEAWDIPYPNPEYISSMLSNTSDEIPAWNKLHIPMTQRAKEAAALGMTTQEFMASGHPDSLKYPRTQQEYMDANPNAIDTKTYNRLGSMASMTAVAPGVVSINPNIPSMTKEQALEESKTRAEDEAAYKVGEKISNTINTKDIHPDVKNSYWYQGVGVLGQLAPQLVANYVLKNRGEIGGKELPPELKGKSPAGGYAMFEATMAQEQVDMYERAKERFADNPTALAASHEAKALGLWDLVGNLSLLEISGKFADITNEARKAKGLAELPKNTNPLLQAAKRIAEKYPRTAAGLASAGEELWTEEMQALSENDIARRRFNELSDTVQTMKDTGVVVAGSSFVAGVILTAIGIRAKTGSWKLPKESNAAAKAGISAADFVTQQQQDEAQKLREVEALYQEHLKRVSPGEYVEGAQFYPEGYGIQGEPGNEGGPPSPPTIPPTSPPTGPANLPPPFQTEQPKRSIPETQRLAEEANRRRAEAQEIANDNQGREGIPGQIIEGEKPIEAGPKQGPSGEEVGASGVVQEQGEEKVKSGFAIFLGRLGYKWQSESIGQDILDTMEETGESAQTVSESFWANTYPKLPPNVQAKFDNYVRNLTGDRTTPVLDLAKTLSEDFPLKIEHLEGTERGYIALMKQGNTRLAEYTQQKAITVGETSSLATALADPMTSQTPKNRLSANLLVHRLSGKYPDVNFRTQKQADGTWGILATATKPLSLGKKETNLGQKLSQVGMKTAPEEMQNAQEDSLLSDEEKPKTRLAANARINELQTKYPSLLFSMEKQEDGSWKISKHMPESLGTEYQSAEKQSAAARPAVNLAMRSVAQASEDIHQGISERDKADLFKQGYEVSSEEAKAWVESPSKEPGSFEWAAEVIGAPAEQLRQQVLEGKADPKRMRQAAMFYMWGGPLAMDFDSATGKFSALHDRKVRFWFSDLGAGFKDWGATKYENVPHKISEAYTHPEAFKQYPELRDVTFASEETGFNLGYFDPNKKHIGLSHYLSTSEANEVVRHEIQHFVQDKEGFATGGSSTNLSNLLSNVDKVSSYLERMKDIKDNGIQRALMKKFQSLVSQFQQWQKEADITKEELDTRQISYDQALRQNDLDLTKVRQEQDWLLQAIHLSDQEKMQAWDEHYEKEHNLYTTRSTLVNEAYRFKGSITKLLAEKLGAQQENIKNRSAPYKDLMYTAYTLLAGEQEARSSVDTSMREELKTKPPSVYLGERAMQKNPIPGYLQSENMRHDETIVVFSKDSQGQIQRTELKGPELFSFDPLSWFGKGTSANLPGGGAIDRTGWAYRQLGGVPQWNAKQIPIFKPFYEVAKNRVAQANQQLAGWLEGVKSVGKLSAQERIDYSEILLSIEGQKIAGITAPQIEQYQDAQGNTLMRQDPAYAVQYRGWLDTKNLSDKLKNALADTRNAYDRAFVEHYNILAKRGDVAESTLQQLRDNVGFVPNYVPHMWYGNHFVDLSDKDGKLVGRIPVDVGLLGKTLGKTSIKNVMDLLKTDPRFKDLEMSELKDREEMKPFYINSPIPLDVIERVLAVAADKVIEHNPAAAKAAQAMRSAISKEAIREIKTKGFGNFAERKGILGFEEKDLGKVLFDYLHGTSSSLAKLDAAQKYSNLLMELKPNAREEQLISTYIQDEMTPRGKLDEAVAKAKTAAFVRYLGFRIKSGVVNLFNIAANGIPVLSIHTHWAGTKVANAAKDITLQYGKELPQRRMDVGIYGVKKGSNILPQDEIDMLHNLLQRGVMDHQFINDVNENLKDKYNLSDKFVNLASIFMRTTEWYSRSVTGLGAYRAMKNGQIINKQTLSEYGLKPGEKVSAGDPRLEEFTEMVVSDSHGDFGAYNRPTLVRHGAAGKLLSTAYTFRFFSHHLGEMWKYMAFDSGMRGRMALGRSILGQMLVGGVRGFPFAGTLMGLYHLLTKDDPEEDARKQLSKITEDPQYLDAALYGVGAGGFGGTPRVSLGASVDWDIPEDIISLISWPITGKKPEFRESMSGIVGSTIKDIVGGVNAVIQKNPGRALEYLTPFIAARDIMVALREAREGPSTITGKPIIAPGEEAPRKLGADGRENEIAARMAGMPNLDSDKAWRLKKSLATEAQMRQGKAAALASDFANALKTGNSERQIQIVNELLANNLVELAADRMDQAISPESFRQLVRERISPETTPKQQLERAIHLKKAYGF